MSAEIVTTSGPVDAWKDPGTEWADSLDATREREVTQLLAEGKSSKEVAALLNLSTKTAGTHRNNIMQNMGFHSTLDFVVYAIRNNIVQVVVSPEVAGETE